MEFIPDFGKYSFYVWTCYGVSIAVLLAFTITTLRRNAQRPK